MKMDASMDPATARGGRGPGMYAGVDMGPAPATPGDTARGGMGTGMDAGEDKARGTMGTSGSGDRGKDTARSGMGTGGACPVDPRREGRSCLVARGPPSSLMSMWV